jgi:phenylalanyl-tRNA synthetase beta chain
VRQAWELREEVLVLEISTDELLEKLPGARRFGALDRFPAVERDLSVLCSESVAADEIKSRVRAAAGPKLRAVSLVDRYSGGQLPAGTVSLTVNLRFQDAERTLTSEEVQAAVDAVVRDLQAEGYEIRGQ